MRISDLLRRVVPANVRLLEWSALVERAATGDLDALAAVASSRPGLAWYLVGLTRRTGVEDADEVLLEALWRAVHARRPSPEALYGTMRSHVMRAARRSRRWRESSIPADVALMLEIDSGVAGDDPVVDRVLASLAVSCVPTDVLRIASLKALTSTVLSAADRQRLHRWRVSPAGQLVTSAA